MFYYYFAPVEPWPDSAYESYSTIIFVFFTCYFLTSLTYNVFVELFYIFTYFFKPFTWLNSIENPYSYILSAEGFDIFLLGEFIFNTCGESIGELWKVTLGDAILTFWLLLSFSLFKELFKFVGFGVDKIGILIYGIY